MSIKFKSGVKIKEFTPFLEKVLTDLRILQQKFVWIPKELVVTSINDSTHMENSRHYKDEALDLRSKNFEEESDKMFFILTAKDILGPKFTILYEGRGLDNEHFHIQVKKGGTYP